MALALAATAEAQTQPPTLLADPNEPESRAPPAGRSLFDELFGVPPQASGEGGARIALPFPFERMLETLNAQIAPAEATAVLIPLGRSLQRLSADPDWFASPRVVVAIAEDPGGLDRSLLEDRLFLGYHERAQVIEVIAYNESAGRFEFQVVDDYGPGLIPRVEYAERSVCVACHQAHGPIFPTALWSETNANPELAWRLSALGETFHGAPVEGGVDRADAFDRATDRAARLAFANALWAEGCGGPDEPRAVRCRGALLLAALRYRLGGTRALPDDGFTGHLLDRLGRVAPAGLGVPSPDLPNRNPLAEIEAGVPMRAAIEPEGAFDPAVPRGVLRFWRPPQPLAFAPREIAASFADADIIWLDRTLAGTDARETARKRAPCRAHAVDRSGHRREIRLDCAGEALALEGYVTLEHDRPTGGRIRSLTLGDEVPVRRLAVAGDLEGKKGPDLVLELREASLGLSARLAGGERLSPLLIEIGEDGTATIELAVIDDLAPLRRTVEEMVEAARFDPEADLGEGPLRRRAVLARLRTALDPR